MFGMTKRAGSVSQAETCWIGFRWLQTIRHKSLVTRDSSLSNPGELGTRSKLVEERIFIYGWVGAVVSLDSKPQHPQSGIGLTTISEVPGEEIIDLRVVVHLYASGQFFDLRWRLMLGTR